jgi:hypothetical protein
MVGAQVATLQQRCEQLLQQQYNFELQKDPLFCNEHIVQVHPKRKRKIVASIQILGPSFFVHPHFLSCQACCSKKEKKKKNLSSSKIVIVTIAWV